MESNNEVINKMKDKKKIIIGAAAAVVAIIALVVVLLTRPTKIGVADTVDVKFSGYDGYGNASIVNAYDWSDNIKYDRNMSLFEQMAMISMLENAVSYSLSENSNLSNGDKVTLTIDVDKDVFKQFGFTAKSQKKTFKVSGLKEAVSYNPFDHVTASVNGYTGYGELSLEISNDLLAGLKFTASKTEGLSNGDEITITVDRTPPVEGEDVIAFCAKKGYKVEQTSVKYTVNGLKEQVAYNPFEHMSVNVTGVAPYAELKVVPSAELLEGLKFTASKTEGLTNGDVVTITVDVEDRIKEDLAVYCAKRGYKLSETSFEYTVTGVNAYVQSLDEFPVEWIEKIKTSSENIISTQFERSIKNMKDYCSNLKSLEKMEYVGHYLFNAKPGVSEKDKNKIVVLHKITATSSEGTFDYYYATVYFNALLLEGKTFSVDLANYHLTAAEFTKGTYIRHYTYWNSEYDQKYNGFLTLDSFVQSLVVPWSENYTYKTTVK